VSSQKINEDLSLRRAFDAIQNEIQKRHFLYYQDPTRPLYADVDSSLEYGVGAIMYHVEGDPEPIITNVENKEGLGI
jgi:hypothetical protein